MNKLSKLILPIIIAAAITIIYSTYFAPKQGLGSFSKFSTGSEVNQEINVRVVKHKGFERDVSGNVIAFYAIDQNNVELRVALRDPETMNIINADVVELLGHLHKNIFTASEVIIE
jgi:hypothetical protein